MIESIPYVLTGIGIIISILYYTSVLRNANKTQQMQLETRQAQLFMQIHNKWSDIEYKTEARKLLRWEFKDTDEYLEKYSGPDKVEYEGHISAINTYLEGVAVLIDRDLVDASLVDELMSGYIVQYWEKFGPVHIELRSRLNYPHLSEWVEYLYNIIKKITIGQHPELETNKIKLSLNKPNR